MHRAEGQEFIELCYDNFVKKVREVLGDGALHFKNSYSSTQGKLISMYRFPKHKATLMAMSYSHRALETI